MARPRPHAHRPPSRRFKAGAAALVLAAGLAVAEGGARVVGAALPSWNGGAPRGVLMTGSDTRLWSMAPGTFANGRATATINAWGVRGELPTLPRDPARDRVLVLGDSSFFGHGIDDEETIAVKLEAELQAAGVAAEVFNGAIPGYSTEQTLLLLEEVGWKHDPTLLVIGNLWSDNNIDAYRDVDLLRSAQASQHNPLMVSAFVRLTASWIDQARGGTGARLVTWQKGSAWPLDQDRRVPIQDYAANLDRMVRDAKERGTGVIFVAPVNRGLADGRYDGGAIWDAFFEAQRQVAAWHHVPVVSSRDALALDPAPNAEKFIDVMHPSARGAGLIAAGVAKGLHDAGWPENRLLGREEPFDPLGLTDDARSYALPMSRQESPMSMLFPQGDTASAHRDAIPNPAPGGQAPAPAPTPHNALQRDVVEPPPGREPPPLNGPG